ncbi:MAG TPA: right-handed parallel beta-helix repeat-containing protein [Candidatus Binatia bacterium]|jgi:hypothetical protein|nr:right-handed parallel beta-helix repeat-containing protein [Candidatus Binatia bacterium]
MRAQQPDGNRSQRVARIDVEFQFRTDEREALKRWCDENRRFARSKLRAVLLAVALWVAATLCGRAAATYWYVSNSGDDNNPGTNVAAPLQHIQTAVNRAAYGDTVNIQAGTYREQIEIDSIRGTGNATNMLTVQAWDTNGDGMIETSEMPVLNPFQLITNNWSPLTNGPLWTNLTGGMAFVSGAIYSTPWAPQSTKDEPFELVIASPTNVLQQTSWPQGQKAGVWPSSQPTSMFPGSFRYDYARHVLYVWRRDGQAPGPQYPIEAPLISTNSPAWGDAGPWVSYPGYVHLRGLVLRFCNSSPDAFNLYGKAWPSIAVLTGPSNVVEQCDIEWGVWQGISAATSGTITTNCVIANHGMLGLSIGPATNNQVLGNFFFNNGWRHYAGDVTEGTCWMGGNCADNILAGNVFSNNWGDAIHCDTVTTPPDHPIRIVGNFILTTNALPNFLGGGGILMEVSSSAWIINNVIVTSGNSAINLAGSHWNRVLFNTCFANFNPDTPPQCLNVAAYINRDTDGITLHSYDAGFNLVAYNIFAGYGDEALMAVQQDSSAGATSFGPLCYSNAYIGNIIFNVGSQFRSQMNVTPPPYLQVSLGYFNDATGWASAVCGGNPGCSTSANIVTNPLFVAANAVNFSTPTAFMLASNSPASGYAPTNYNVTFDFAGNPRQPGSTAAGAFDNVRKP